MMRKSALTTAGDAARAFEAVAALAGSPQKAVPLIRAGLKPAAGR
jgi:hypothetical protein